MTVAFTLRALRLRWGRLGRVALIVAVGVATVTGAIIFRASTRAAYRQLVAGTDRGAQLIVSAAQAGSVGLGSGATAAQLPPAPSLSPGLLRRIRHVPGVGAAAGQLIAPVTIEDRSGRALASTPPALALSVPPAPFSALHLLRGRIPVGSGQLALDADTAAREGWHLGDRVRILTAAPARALLLVGIVAGGISGAQRTVVLSGLAAHRLYGSRGFTQIDVALAPGARASAVAAAVAARLPPGVGVQSASAAAGSVGGRLAGAFATLDAGLTAFAAAAMLIGALVIFNTFSITATQRQREFALLRALGATRPQVLVAALIEALAVGVLGGLVGAGLGVPLALLIRVVSRAAGAPVAGSGLSVSLGVLALGAGIGIAVALTAGLLPALRARRAAPVEALRVSLGAAGRPRPRTRGLLRAGVSAGLGAGGLILLLSAGGDLHRRLLVCGIGAGLVLLGALIAGPLAVGGLTWLARVRRGDPIFALAREQAQADSGRVALSASSLLIGIALALVVSVYASGLRAATATAVRQNVRADLVVQSASGARPIPAASVRAVAAVPDLAAVATLRTVTGRLAGGSVQIAGVDPTTWPGVYRFHWQGSPVALPALGPRDVLVEADTARAAHLRVGSRLALGLPDGRRLTLRVAGIYVDPGLLAGVTLPLTSFDATIDQPQLQDVFITLTHAVSDRVALTALVRALGPYPGVVVRSPRGLAARLAANVTSVVDLLYALLALAVVMSLLGIGGSLTLSVQTRATELGTLRALGMTPRQTAALVRGESLLTALFGLFGGVVLGLGLAVGLIHALRPEGLRFSFPWPACGGALLAAALAGGFATLGPARRAARLSVLGAISDE